MRWRFVVLRTAWRDRGEPGSLVRYEDLIQNPTSVLAPLLERCGLDARPETVARLLRATNAPELRGHGSSHSPAASIGRWSKDLSPEMQRKVTERFSDLLADFSYPSE